MNSQRVFNHFIPSKNDVFEGHMFDICYLLSQLVESLVDFQNSPKNSHLFTKFQCT